jgi:hypothetical protein
VLAGVEGCRGAGRNRNVTGQKAQKLKHYPDNPGVYYLMHDDGTHYLCGKARS